MSRETYEEEKRKKKAKGKCLPVVFGWLCWLQRPPCFIQRSCLCSPRELRVKNFLAVTAKQKESHNAGAKKDER